MAVVVGLWQWLLEHSCGSGCRARQWLLEHSCGSGCRAMAVVARAFWWQWL